MIVGGYILDLYCDNERDTYPNKNIETGESMDIFGHTYNEFPHQYVGEWGSVCRSEARKKGWLISKKRVLCPKCSGK